MLTKQELLILSNLRKNARITLTSLSRETRVPISTIYDKLREFENNIIYKHTSLIDFAKLGYFTRANIVIRALQKQKEELKEYLMRHKNINSLYKINNGYDFQIECIFHHMKELEEFLENLEHKFKVRNKMVFYLIDDIKREDFFNCPEMIPLTPLCNYKKGVRNDNKHHKIPQTV